MLSHTFHRQRIVQTSSDLCSTIQRPPDVPPNSHTPDCLPNAHRDDNPPDALQNCQRLTGMGDPLLGQLRGCALQAQAVVKDSSRHRNAGGGIGQPLSLLLKMNKLVTELALYDIAGTPGVAADLSHCNTPVKVTAHTEAGELPTCLEGCDLVVIPAGVPRKPGMTRDDLFNTNAGVHLRCTCAALYKRLPYPSAAVRAETLRC